MTNNKKLKGKKSKPYMYNTQEHNKFIYTFRQYKYTIFNNFQQTQKKNK